MVDVSLVAVPGQLQRRRLPGSEVRVSDATDNCQDAEEVLAQIVGIDLRRPDFRTLHDGNCLNDNVVNAYVGLLRRHAHGSGDAWIFNTFFLGKYANDGYHTVQRWTKHCRHPKGLFDKRLVVMPVHLPGHWACIAINFKKKTFRYYDSLDNGGSKKCRSMKAYLDEEHLQLTGARFDWTGWAENNGGGSTPYCNGDMPQQTNATDCGVFMCQLMRCLVLEKEIDFNMETMPTNRRTMILEMLNVNLTSMMTAR